MRDVILEKEAAVPVHPKMTMREAVEWLKGLLDVAPLTGEETEYMNGRWGYLVQMIADREGVPVGWLSYSLFSLAEQEVRLLQTAVAEGTTALATGDEDEQAQALPSIS